MGQIEIQFRGDFIQINLETFADQVITQIIDGVDYTVVTMLANYANFFERGFHCIVISFDYCKLVVS